MPCHGLASPLAATSISQSVARKPKLLARNNNNRCGCSGKASAPPLPTSRLNQHHLAEPIVNRDDVLVWLSVAWFVALCGAAIWVLSSPAHDIFGH